MDILPQNTYHERTMDSEPQRDVRPMPERFTRKKLLEGFELKALQIQQAENPETAMVEFIAQSREKAASMFPEQQNEAIAVVDEMETLLRSGDETFAEKASDGLGKIFEHIYEDPVRAERFHQHLRDNERADRHRIVEAAKGTPLSPEQMVYGLFDPDSDERFRLHIAMAFTLEPAEKLVDFRKGMRELARRVKEDPAFANTKEIIGTSWLVGEHPRVAEQFGFHVATEPLSPEDAPRFANETRKVSRCWMSREELLAKWG
jgi:hypothetical protein